MRRSAGISSSAALDASAVEAALATIEPEIGRAAALVARVGADPKAARRLAAKGFSADAVEAVMETE